MSCTNWLSSNDSELYDCTYRSVCGLLQNFSSAKELCALSNDELGNQLCPVYLDLDTACVDATVDAPERVCCKPYTANVITAEPTSEPTNTEMTSIALQKSEYINVFPYILTALIIFLLLFAGFYTIKTNKKSKTTSGRVVNRKTRRLVRR